MKVVRKLIIILMAGILMAAGQFSLAGDVGEGGGKPRMVNFEELKSKVATFAKYVRLEELARMGEVGSGGGGVRKWNKELQDRISRRMAQESSSRDLRPLEGRRFDYERKLMPEEEFGKFDIRSVVVFYTSTQGSIEATQIYSYSILDGVEAHKDENLLKDLISFETLEGVIISRDEILGVGVEFRVKP